MVSRVFAINAFFFSFQLFATLGIFLLKQFFTGSAEFEICILLAKDVEDGLRYHSPYHQVLLFLQRFFKDLVLDEVNEAATVFIGRNCTQLAAVCIFEDALCHHFQLLARIKCLQIVNYANLIAPLFVLADVQVPSLPIRFCPSFCILIGYLVSFFVLHAV